MVKRPVNNNTQADGSGTVGTTGAPPEDDPPELDVPPGGLVPPPELDDEEGTESPGIPSKGPLNPAGAAPVAGMVGITAGDANGSVGNVSNGIPGPGSNTLPSARSAGPPAAAGVFAITG